MKQEITLYPQPTGGVKITRERYAWIPVLRWSRPHFRNGFYLFRTVTERYVDGAWFAMEEDNRGQR